MADLLILAIETATECGSVALTRGYGPSGKILAEYTVRPEQSHSRRLLGLVATMMQTVGIAWNDVDAIAVSQGPGSFTGLRIGMAAAKGMARAAAIPLVAVPTLNGLAAQVTSSELPICCLLDARKQQVYAALYQQENGSYRRVSPFHVLAPDTLLRQICKPTLLIGPGLQAYLPLFTAHPLARIAPSGYLLHPRAATIAWCAAQMLADGADKMPTDPIPLYVRASEAELSLNMP